MQAAESRKEKYKKRVNTNIPVVQTTDDGGTTNHVLESKETTS